MFKVKLCQELYYPLQIVLQLLGHDLSNGIIINYSTRFWVLFWARLLKLLDWKPGGGRYWTTNCHSYSLQGSNDYFDGWKLGNTDEDLTEGTSSVLFNKPKFIKLINKSLFWYEPYILCVLEYFIKMSVPDFRRATTEESPAITTQYIQCFQL